MAYTMLINSIDGFNEWCIRFDGIDVRFHLENYVVDHNWAHEISVTGRERWIGQYIWLFPGEWGLRCRQGGDSSSASLPLAAACIVVVSRRRWRRQKRSAGRSAATEKAHLPTLLSFLHARQPPPPPPTVAASPPTPLPASTVPGDREEIFREHTCLRYAIPSSF